VVAYESVLRSTRPGYHAAAAAWLVARSGERAGERAGLIGAHYEQAGEREAAADWYARAARHAHDSSAHATAIDCYRRALALSDGAARLELQSALYGGLGDALLEQGRYAEAAESYEQLARLTAAAGDAAAAARAWLGQAEVHDGQGHHQAALECAQRARALAAGGSPDTLVLVLCRQAQSLYRLGRAPEAGAVAREALERAGALGARAEMALSLNLLGEVAETLGEPDLAGAYRARALDLYLALGNRYRVASLLSGAGDAERRRGRPVAALALYGEALAVARAVGYRALELSLAGELAALEPAGATPSI
jgi:tetratricopeptide (TPR) repeat protein